MSVEATATTFEAVDESRLESIVAEHFDLLWRFMRRLGLPEGDLGDAVQETVVVLARRLAQVQAGSERAFVLSAAFRVAAEFRRRVRRRREVDDSALRELQSSEHDPELRLTQKRLRRLLERVLEELPIELRAVFVLYELEEFTMAEIAGSLGIPPGTVASRLRRARVTFEQRAAIVLKDQNHDE